MNWRWKNCVWSREDNAVLLTAVLADKSRRVLLIGGAGFDPRTTRVFQLLIPLLGPRLKVLLFREERPRPQQTLVQRAERQIDVFQNSGVAMDIISIDIFSVDGAPVGGRDAVARLASYKGIEEFTDLVVDFSALSLGVAFPITKYLLALAEQLEANLHVTTVDSPEMDRHITSVPTDKATPVHGCQGEWGLDGSSEATKLWLPLLVEGGKGVLERIYRTVTPDDTCPILPFPSRDPRRGDKLLAEYWDEIDRSWQIAAQNLIYASESDPVDLYRSILRVDDVRRGVFKELGGSLTILSPLGTKVMAIGAFMASAEREFPVFHVEAHEYSIKPDVPETVDDGVHIVHVWLAGEPYRTRAEAAADATSATHSPDVPAETPEATPASSQ